MPTDTRTIGNDEGDVYCDVCERKDWYTAIEITFDGERRKIVCLNRYEGESCADVILATTVAVD